MSKRQLGPKHSCRNLDVYIMGGGAPGILDSIIHAFALLISSRLCQIIYESVLLADQTAVTKFEVKFKPREY